MPFVVKQNKAPNLLDIAFFSMISILQNPADISHLIEQLSRFENFLHGEPNKIPIARVYEAKCSLNLCELPSKND